MTCELPKVCQRKTVRARKAHTCCECRRTIAPGTAYERTDGIWSEAAASFKTCERCARIRDSALRRYPPDFEDEGPGFGFLFEYIRLCRG